MKFLIVPIVFLAISKLCLGGPLRLQKRAAFYIANETACVVDNTVYSSGDPIPTDDPCEACKCRPPGFACVLKECQVKPGCRAVRRAGHCCPEYICGCEHNGRMYRDGDEIRDSKNPCYTCHCQGSSIACAFVDCLFRVDCSPEYVVGECCPRYPQCSSSSNSNSSHAVESTIDPDIGSPVTALPHSDTSLLDESKVEYVVPETSPVDEKSAPSETTVDSDIAPAYIPDATNEEILERNNAGTTENAATTQSNPITEKVLDDVDEKPESPDLLNTESDIKKEYVEESAEEVLTTEVSPESTTVAGLKVEIFADETTSHQESFTTIGVESTTDEDMGIEANTIEKTFRALNFTSEGDSETEDKEKSDLEETEEESEKEKSESDEKEESNEEKSESDEKEKSESDEKEEKSESDEKEESESDLKEESELKEEKSEPDVKEESELKEKKSESDENEKKSESDTEEKSETPEFQKSETPDIKEESESPENREDSGEETLASVAQDVSSTSAIELVATELTNSPAASETTVEPTTKKPESILYVDDKISLSESSEKVTVLVTVHETNPQKKEETTTSTTEYKDASTSDSPSDTSGRKRKIRNS